MQTFRLVTFPLLRSSLVAGALLAFGLSFDEIVVTTFTAGPGTPTLPIWIFNNLFRPNQAPVVNVVAVVLVLISILPVWAAQRLGGEGAVESRFSRFPDSPERKAARQRRTSGFSFWTIRF